MKYKIKIFRVHLCHKLMKGGVPKGQCTQIDNHPVRHIHLSHLHTFPPIITVLGTKGMFGSFLRRLYIVMMCRMFINCLLYSWMRFTWTSNIELGSTVTPYSFSMYAASFILFSYKRVTFTVLTTKLVCHWTRQLRKVQNPYLGIPRKVEFHFGNHVSNLYLYPSHKNVSLLCPPSKLLTFSHILCMTVAYLPVLPSAEQLGDSYLLWKVLVSSTETSL